MSVGNYLYAGELMEKTHFMSRKTHSTDQGNMRNQLENENQAEMDQNEPKYPRKCDRHFKSSQVQGMGWNISYAHFIPLEVMFHLSPFCFTLGRAKAKCGGVVDGS